MFWLFFNSKKSPWVQGEVHWGSRRDKQAEAEVSDRSELEVTPHFQKFVASRLDELLLKQVEDVAKVVGNVEEHSVEDLGIKLTRKSKVAVRLGRARWWGSGRGPPSDMDDRTVFSSVLKGFPS